MNEYQKSRVFPNDVTVTLQSGLFCTIFNTFAESGLFSWYFFQLSWYKDRSWTNFILCECLTDHNYVIYKNITSNHINHVHHLAQY